MPYLFRDSALDFDNLDKMDLEAALLDPSFFIGFVSPALNTNEFYSRTTDNSCASEGQCSK